MQQDVTGYRRGVLYIIIVAGLVSWASLTCAISLGRPIALIIVVQRSGYVLAWLACTFLPGAIAAAVFAPFFFRRMFIAMKNGESQSRKAAVLGMCIGLVSCIIFPILSAFVTGLTEGFDQLGDQKGLLYFGVLGIFGVLPAIGIGAVTGRLLESISRKQFMQQVN